MTDDIEQRLSETGQTAASIDDDRPVGTDAMATTAASTTYKVLGEFGAQSGAGVLGKNTAGSGTPVGVEGTVPNVPGGYGLATSGDARVGGTAELAALAGSLTGGQSVSDLLGPGLTLSSGTLVATPARLDVDDGTTTVTAVEGITFGHGFAVTDDGDGTATVER